MKTSEWLETLPEPYRSAALSQRTGFDLEVDSLYKAVGNFAVWSATREGHDFWEDVHNAIEAITPLPTYSHWGIEDLCSALTHITP